MLAGWSGLTLGGAPPACSEGQPACWVCNLVRGGNGITLLTARMLVISLGTLLIKIIKMLYNTGLRAQSSVRMSKCTSLASLVGNNSSCQQIFQQLKMTLFALSSSKTRATVADRVS